VKGQTKETLEWRETVPGDVGTSAGSSARRDSNSSLLFRGISVIDFADDLAFLVVFREKSSLPARLPHLQTGELPPLPGKHLANG